MSAPTPAPGDDRPREGYYPDPSIPGYVRYWNGASWVPGTSRPAPLQGESTPETPAGTDPEPQRPSAPGPAPAQQSGPAHTPVDETGPVFLDEEPYGPDRPEPASAWQADVSRQTGFGGERDRRVSWGGTGQPGGPGEQGAAAAQDPRTPAGRTPADRAQGGNAPTDRVPTDPRGPGSQDPTGGALPGMRDGNSHVPESTVAIRVNRPGRSGGVGGTGSVTGAGSGEAGRPAAEGRAGRPPRPHEAEQEPGGGTMSIRAVAPGTTPQASAPAPAPAPGPTPAPAPAPAPAELNNPLTPGPGGGAASWAQQVHQLAAPQQQQQQLPPQQQQRQPQFRGPQPDQPVVPWKPPVNDHFQQLAQAQAAARPAGLGKRFAARLVDTVVLGALVGAVAFPLVTRAMDHIEEKIDAAKLSGETVTVWLVDSTTSVLFGGALAAFLVLGVLLEALPTAKWGRTLGKKLCGLEVRDIESHSAPGFGAALRRWLVYGVLGILVIGVVNVVWCLFDRPWRQCWHDKAARTFVAG
ncbi:MULTISPECIES: RDD family protein [unclassified Streptomyces]|uniref:RDD family protein n=1 Tax=unclassified Streptomyces TaxID=2593676 RepID=UPI002DDA386A|nr:RDD family protein [Streptomyces sp. NBC_01763]WSC37251.1 RDD family protein [Streptomyces sp. NBC_01763]WSF86479.1 RDD family protein [Streptomyces sp. NBC_01744]